MTRIDPVSFYHQARTHFAARDAVSLCALVERRCPSLKVNIVFKDINQSPWSVKWYIDNSGRSTFFFPYSGINIDTASIFAARWSSMFDLYLACQSSGVAGSLDLHLGDASEGAGLVYCKSYGDGALIPDSDYMASRSYNTLRELWTNRIPWTKKKEKLFWRGSSTGVRDTDAIAGLPRVRLCALTKVHPDLDCYLTSAVQVSAEEAKFLSEIKLMGGFIDQSTYDSYRYHVDIDGNSSAWSSLFCKLLSGGLVFKVDSPSGYNQWYYNKLKPWHNFVPVKSDLSDLIVNFRLMQSRLDQAREIADRGRELALSLTYESEISFARDRAVELMSRGEKMPLQEAALLRNGNPFSSLLAILLDNSISRGGAGDGKVSPDVLNMEGMSGRCYRLAINNLIASLPMARYLEVGSWAGSTSCSAMEGNRVRAVCIDNWSEFGGPKAQFLENVHRYGGLNADFRFIEADFRSAPFADIGRFNVYLFDGPHAEKDQYDGLALALPALDDQFVFIVDDWNWDYVRRGTLSAIAANGLLIDYSVEIRTTLDNSHPEVCRQHSDWHNGYFFGVLTKRKELEA